MTPQEFVAKWRDPQGTEKALSQSHFIDLCHMLGVPAPTDEGTDPDSYTFEKGCELTGGSQGWADVWRRRCFAWEYKGPDRDLRRAYDQPQAMNDSSMYPERQSSSHRPNISFLLLSLFFCSFADGFESLKNTYRYLCTTHFPEGRVNH